jgi:glycogen(starch) synthase
VTAVPHPREALAPAPAAPFRVLRLCSVYEAPTTSIGGTGALLDPVGGMQTHTAALTRALAERGVRQDVVTAFRAGAPRRERSGPHVVVHRVGVPLRRLRQLYSGPAFALALRIARDADLVHVHQGEDLAALPIALAAARRARIPLVVTIHTSLAHTLRVVDLRTALLRRAGGKIEAAAAGRADAVIVLTPRLKRLAVAAGVPEARIEVIPSGVERSLFGPDGGDPFPTLPRPRVLFLGRLAAQKDVPTLLRAAAHVDAHLLLVGDGPERRSLEEQARELGIEGRVTFAGFLERRRVPDALRHSDVLVLPSAYEELGSALIEGMWTGIPIVASRTGGIPEVVEDGRTAILVDPGDAAGFARAINRILTDGGLAERLRAGALEQAAGYDWELLAARVHAVYQRVLARANPRAAAARSR